MRGRPDLLVAFYRSERLRWADQDQFHVCPEELHRSFGRPELPDALDTAGEGGPGWGTYGALFFTDA
jgi:hypothetical protein